MGRAVAGALLFSIPLYMTMEMWWLGFSMNRWRLALFTLVTLLLLVGVAYYRGLDDRQDLREAVIDAFLGYGVGVIVGTLFLYLVGVIEPGMSADEIVGKVALQATAGGLGALLARGQLGQREEKPEEQEPPAQRYLGELFIMLVGALFVASTLAPTEEMLLIAYQITPWHALALVALSLGVLHAFVYAVEFRGQHHRGEDESVWSAFRRFTVVGYVLVLLASLYMLWSFGRLDGTAFTPALHYAVVLAVPGTLGAAAARLIL
jgi:putative integral membrane protein (TIGR02587 family)